MRNITKEIEQKIALGYITKTELADMLGITRVTLDTRLKKGNWKKGERHLLLNYLFNLA
jgi:DNA-binding NtrC family response regulator